MNTAKYLLVAIVMGSISGGAYAHHSFSSHFDPSKTYEVEGVLTKFSMRNPHSFFSIDVKGENGAVEKWEVELGSMVHLRRKGINRETFAIGDVIKISAWPNRVPGKKLVYGISFVDARGQRYGDYPGNKIETVAASEAGVEAIFGRWISPLPGDQNLPAMPLNEAGELAAENYIASLSPATICEPLTIPDLQISPYMTDIRMADGMINFIHESYGVTRSIPLNSPAARVEATGWMGIASAHIDGDELVIESRNYPVSRWGLGGAAQPRGSSRVDYPSSPLKTVVERYSVSDDGQTLILAVTVDDAAYLKEPYKAKITARRVADTEKMYPFECDVEAAARFSR